MKGAFVSNEPRGVAGPVRDKIREMEIGLVNPKRLGADGVVRMLKLRDELESEVAALEQQGVDLRPEKTRLESIDGILVSKAGALVRVLFKKGGLAAVRREENPPREHWWWYLDSYLAERRRKWLIRTGITLTAIVVLLLGVNWVMDKFFGLSPTEKAAYDHSSRGEQYAMDGDYAKAVSEYEQAAALTPNNGETLTALGVLYEKQGQLDKAKETLAAAEQAFEDRATYLVTLAQSYRMVAEPDKAMQAANQAIEADPNSAQAYYVRSILDEDKGDIPAAITDVNKAATLADEQGQTELYVLARQRYGILLQSGSGF